MLHHDLVIVGAGPAGAAAAVTGRRMGLSVALVDKARFPRAKLCGGLVTGRCARHLQDVFGLDMEPQFFETRRNFEFHFRNIPLGTLENVPPLYLTTRWEFDDLLLQAALRLGAADYTGNRVKALDTRDNTLTLGSGKSLGYGVLVGADGVQSLVARHLYGRPFDPKRIGFALEVEAPPIGPDETTPIRIDFAAANWGYGWHFPKRQSTTIGVGGLQAENPAMKVHMARYLDTLGTGRKARVRGHFLPFGSPRRFPGRRNVLLAGDAAGLVDPITGEGIGYAILSGNFAARAAAEALGAGGRYEALRRYARATAPIRRAIGHARMLRPLMFSRPLQPLFSRAFAESRTLKRDFMHLLSGEKEYPEILRGVAIRLPSGIRRHILSGDSRI